MVQPSEAPLPISTIELTLDARHRGAHQQVGSRTRIAAARAVQLAADARLRAWLDGAPARHHVGVHGAIDQKASARGLHMAVLESLPAGACA
jgi:hypothetical protein